jgi:hypothetical protein
MEVLAGEAVGAGRDVRPNGGVFRTAGGRAASRLARAAAIRRAGRRRGAIGGRGRALGQWRELGRTIMNRTLDQTVPPGLPGYRVFARTPRNIIVRRRTEPADTRPAIRGIPRPLPSTGQVVERAALTARWVQNPSGRALCNQAFMLANTCLGVPPAANRELRTGRPLAHDHEGIQRSRTGFEGVGGGEQPSDPGRPPALLRRRPSPGVTSVGPGLPSVRQLVRPF